MANTLEHTNPRFLCVSLTNRSTHKELALHHEISNEPAGALLESLRDGDPLKDLLSQASSLRLYCDNLSDASAFYIAHPDEWGVLKAELEDWIVGREPPLPSWFGDAIVFAEVPNSSVYYIYLTSSEKGSVFEYSGAGDEFTQVSESLEAFLDYICNPNDSLIDDIQSHTRFSDGVSDIQWLPKKYLHD